MNNQALIEMNAIVANFLSHDQYHQWISNLGKTFNPAVGIRERDNFVRGCENNLWLTVEPFENSIRLCADSDSMVTLGIVHILQKALDDTSPTEARKLALYDIHKLIAPLSSVRKKGTQHIINYIHAALDKDAERV